MLTREQMKKVVGGYNPCEQFGGVQMWYCCTPPREIGVTTCEHAYTECFFPTLNPSIC